jgi:uncharacterized protein YdhG (YjbR/CyaY superfamily)
MTDPAPTGVVDEYIAGFPDDVQPILTDVAAAIRRGMPDADEKIRYGMPAFMLEGRYGLHFAGWKRHVGLYPVPRLPAELEARVAPYRAAKDTVQLVYRTGVPYDLVEEIAAAVAARG